jgi:small-conductance mechanosensitive channel
MDFTAFINSEITHNVGSALIIMVLGIIAYVISFYVLKAWAKRKKSFIPKLLQENTYYPGLVLIFFITVLVGLPFIKKHLDTGLYNTLQHALIIALIVAIAWLLSRALNLIRGMIVQHYESVSRWDYSVRKAKTQYQLLQRVLNVVIVVLAISAVLMTFDGIRRIGTTLLASAGVVGLVLGFAAQKSLGTLFAGIQIAVSQAIHLDDVVVTDKGTGIVDEITLTYVVIDTGDGRKVIVPINYFIEKSFENWTRSSPEMLTRVKIYVDYSFPVDILRQQFFKWVEASELWDKRSRDLLVTASDSRAMELTATISVRNPNDASTMECQIREKMISYVQNAYPDSLPKFRVNDKQIP